MSEATWVYGEIDFNEFLNEVVTKEFKQSYHHFYLPLEWSPTSDGYGNPPVEDPLTIRFGTDAFSDDNGILFESSLTAIIDDMIDSYAITAEKNLCIDKEDVLIFTKLAQALQNEVNKLNKLIDNAIDWRK